MKFKKLFRAVERGELSEVWKAANKKAQALIRLDVEAAVKRVEQELLRDQAALRRSVLITKLLCTGKGSKHDGGIRDDNCGPATKNDPAGAHLNSPRIDRRMSEVGDRWYRLDRVKRELARLTT